MENEGKARIFKKNSVFYRKTVFFIEKQCFLQKNNEFYRKTMNFDQFICLAYTAEKFNNEF